MSPSRPRLLTEQCSTCVFRPGNLMHLREGRLHDLVNENLRAGAALTCHQTLSYGEHPDFGEAVCRGFYDAVGPRSQIVRIVERLGGYDEVPPPGTVAVKIENSYVCGRESESVVTVPAPADDDTEFVDWWSEHVHDLTGDGHPCGESEHALYEVTIVASVERPELVGETYSWEG